MDANKREYGGDLLLKDEVYSIVNCALEVANTLGNGFFEKIYEKGLAAEFDTRQIPYRQQATYDVRYKNKVLGQYMPDLVVFGKVIVEVKTIDKITPIERGQVLNYLKVTGLPVGLVLNFKNTRLEWERMVRSQDQ